MDTVSEVNKYTGWAWEMVMEYGPTLILAIITLLAGLWIIKLLTRSLRKLLERRQMDPSLSPFLMSLFATGLKVLLVLSILGMVGVEVMSFVAILGAVGFAVGFALQGSLQNFAGGVMILIFKPFKAGDYVEAAGYSGTIREIQIFNTILTTPDNKTIIIPNGELSGSSMINYSKEATRRVDFKFGIGYGDNVKKAKEILLNIAGTDARVLADPEPFVGLSELADSSVNLVLRVWCNSEDYWGIYFDFQEKVKESFDAEGISFPFPQRDVTLHQENQLFRN